MTPTQHLTARVLTWPGTTVRIGSRGEYAFDAGRTELGHLHDDRVAHFGFPRDVGQTLRDSGRVGPHPVNPHSPKMAARAIGSDADLEEVLSLLRLNYDREIAAHGGETAVRDAVAALDAAQSDTGRFCALLHEDVHVVNVAGVRVQGREALRAAMADAMAGELATVTTRAEILSVSFLVPTVAVVDAVKHISDGRRGSYTLTFVREGGDWLAAALQTTPM
jgi:uncharacterized protein (TIGR02246 family)